MPAVIGRAPPPTRPRMVPRRVGLALQPELERATIPLRVTLDANAPPYAGELREEHTGPRIKAIPNGAIVILATLRRAWNFVGIAVDPGDAAAPGLTAAVRVLTRGVNGIIQPPFAVAIGGPSAFVNLIVGVECELLLSNATGATVHGARGTIWGMSEQ